MLKRIPKELRELDQWVNAISDPDPKKDKRPINSLTGYNADPTKASTWTTFANACANACDNYPHVGFVLSADDPYTIIDLDDPYKPEKDWTDEERESHAQLNAAIIGTFESYTEISQSGKGVHIIVRGSIPKGVNRDTVEMYSCQRFMICTGNVMKDLPIVDCQELLDSMYSQMDLKDNAVELVELEETSSDDSIMEMAMNADNGEKFTTLCNGDFTDYPSQSEADLALMSIIAFYTESNEQCRRLFRMTGLGKRTKAIKNNTYLNYCLSKIRANAVPPVDFDLVLERAKLAMDLKDGVILVDDPIAPHRDITIEHSDYGNAEASARFDKTMADRINKDSQPMVITAQLSAEDMFPPGLIGEIAQYIYSTSVRPVPEIALLAALAMVAGISGQSYNISKTGLNQYLVLLAKTGIGKEGIKGGIDRLIYAVRKHHNMSPIGNYRGPASFASGPALLNALSKQTCCFSIVGEFGLFMQQLCGGNVSSADKSLKAVLLDVFGKSGHTDSLSARVYSDSEKNINEIGSPALTILGESTPETFYEGLSMEAITDGLMPRFSVVEYEGIRPYVNEEHGNKPDHNLVVELTELVTAVLALKAEDKVVEVTYAAGIKQQLKQADCDITDMLNNGGDANPFNKLWTRADQKIKKMAGLIAVSINYHDPVVTQEAYNWAKNFIHADIASLVKRFKIGNVGGGESKQHSDLMRKISIYYKREPTKEYRKYHEKGIIPIKYLKRALSQITSFKNDKRGSGNAINAALAECLECGELVEIPRPQAKNEFQTTSKLFALGDGWTGE